MSSFITLPDLCLLRIFDYLTLSDLSTLDQICSRFCHIQPETYSRRHRLTLHIGKCSQMLLSDPKCQSLPQKEWITNDIDVPIQVGLVKLDFR